MSSLSGGEKDTENTNKDSIELTLQNNLQTSTLLRFFRWCVTKHAGVIIK